MDDLMCVGSPKLVSTTFTRENASSNIPLSCVDFSTTPFNCVVFSKYVLGIKALMKLSCLS